MVSLDSASTPWLSCYLDSIPGDVRGLLSGTQSVVGAHNHAEEE